MQTSTLLSSLFLLTSLTSALDNSKSSKQAIKRQYQRNGFQQRRQTTENLEETETTSPSFTLSVSLSDNAELNKKPIVARQGKFWVGGETNAVCPPEEAEIADACPPLGVTAIKIDAQAGTAMMAAKIKTPQTLYIPTINLLQFGLPGAASAPQGSTATFKFTEGDPTEENTNPGPSSSAVVEKRQADVASATQTSQPTGLSINPQDGYRAGTSKSLLETNGETTTYEPGTSGMLTFQAKAAQQGQAAETQPRVWLACKQTGNENENEEENENQKRQQQPQQKPRYSISTMAATAQTQGNENEKRQAASTMPQGCVEIQIVATVWDGGFGETNGAFGAWQYE